MLGTTEGRFAIDHPVMAEQLAEPGGEDLGLSEPFQIAIEAKFPFAAGALQRSHELTAKNPAQHFDGKKERVAGVDPVGVIQRESTGGDHAMDMGMMLEPLSQVCSTLKKPISAPRCLGSRATSSRVAALVRNSRS